MPRTQPALEDVSRPAPRDAHKQKAARPAGSRFVLTAEHASNRIPARHQSLGLTPQQLQSHIAWDPGARVIARSCARALECACLAGRYSRLLVDLNRSLHHPRLMARRSFAVPIPGNRELSAEERERRIRLYYAPFREAVLAEVRRVIDIHGRCIHLSVHSFAPVVDGVRREADMGVLYDPRRRLEARIAACLADLLGVRGFRVRRNYPYRGVSDGHVTALRRLFSERSYAGLELEVNQGLMRKDSDTRRLAREISAAAASLAAAAAAAGAA